MAGIWNVIRGMWAYLIASNLKNINQLTIKLFFKAVIVDYLLGKPCNQHVATSFVCTTFEISLYLLPLFSKEAVPHNCPYFNLHRPAQTIFSHENNTGPMGTYMWFDFTLHSNSP